MELVEPAMSPFPTKSPEALILVPAIAPLLDILVAVKLPWLSKEPKVFLRLTSLKVIPSLELEISSFPIKLPEEVISPPDITPDVLIFPVPADKLVPLISPPDIAPDVLIFPVPADKLVPLIAPDVFISPVAVIPLFVVKIP